LVGVVKFSLVAVTLVVISLFIINFVLPTVAAEPKDVSFQVTDSSGVPVANAHANIWTSDSIDGTYVLESSVLTDANGYANISATTEKYAYFIFEKKGYSVLWPKEDTVGTVAGPEFFAINTSDIVSSETDPIVVNGLDVVPQIWSDKSDYKPGETAIIYGAGFDYDSVQLNITYPDGYKVDNVSVDNNGSFTYNYTIGAMYEEFKVDAIATGSVLASTTFEDSSETTVKLFPLADSWVNYPNFASSNYGTDTILNDENANPPEQRQIYAKFDLSSIPPGSIITAATLHMYSMSWSSQVNQSTGVYFVSNDSWTETGLRWNNKPAIGSLIDSTPVYYNAWAVWNVNSSVQSEYSGDKIISVNLNFPSTDVNNKKDFYSKEYSCSHKWPYLEIKYLNTTTHAECSSGQCMQVNGSGSNQCSINSDCYHSECDYVGRTCKKVNAWPDVTDTCTNFNQCVHSECVGQSCTVIDSPGTSTCTNNSDCVTPKHAECSSGQCVLVNGAGDNKCSINSDCYHSECNFNSQQCISVNTWPDVIDSCTSNEQCTACLPDIVVSKKTNPNSFSICQNTTVTLNVTGTGCPQTVHFPIDAMIVFDRTGSMDDDCPGGVEANTSPCKIHDAKVAAKFFVGLLNPSLDRSGLVSFNNTATLNQGLTFNGALVQNAIDTLKALGQTAIGGGISAANNELTSHGRNNSVWIEILLTDGNENLGSDPLSRANEAKADGIIIYTIGLGASVDPVLLGQIASITGGKYYFAPNGTSLQQIYQNISQEVFSIGGKNVVVNDVIPSYANYADALSSNPPDNCTYSAGTRTVTCNLGNMIIGQSYIITFNEQMNTSGNNILTNVYPASNVTFTDFNNTQQTRIFPQTYVNVTACDDGVFCNGVETCSADQCIHQAPLNCSSLNDQCKFGVCNETSKNCTVSFNSTSTTCNDGLWCSATDHCDGLGSCVQLTARDCSGFNLSKVETCDNTPDSYHFTWDFRNLFTSICNETSDSCTSGNNTITHTCSVANCSAECDATHTCDNKCIGNVRYYAGNCSLTTCNCSYTTQNCDLQDGCYVYQATGCEDRDYFCQVAGCNYTFSNRNIDSYDAYANYCSADTIRTHRTFHDFSCDNGCKDHTSLVNDSLVQDCSLQNGWVNTTNYQWVSATQCIQKEQVQQEYHKFTCSPTVNCTFIVNNTRWIDTGKTNDSDVTGPSTNNLTIQIKCNTMNLTATENDTCSNISEAEYFFDTCPSTGTRGTPLLASDGTFDEKTEGVFQNAINLKNLNDGRHTLYVRGKDDKGNWGPCASKGFDVDVLPPSTSQQNITPSMACGGNPTVTALICDAFDQSKMCSAEYFIDEFNLGNGEGFQMQPVDGTWDGFCEWVTGTVNTTLLAEGTHHIQVHGMDCSCNWGKIDLLPPVWFIKDITSPITNKTLIPFDNKKVDCYGNEAQDSNISAIAASGLTNGCSYVKGGTQIVLSANDHDTPDHEYSGSVSIHWKVWYKVNAGDQWTVDQQGVGAIGQNVTITLNKDSYHLIEYWSIDSCGNEEPHHFELDIVDTKPPIITKTVGDPKVSCDPEDTSGCVYFVKDHVTQINLNCTDQQPHPVNSVNLWYRILLDGQVLQDWTDRIAVQSFKQIIFDEDSVHTLQYYCEDALGNSNGTRNNPHQQVYKVDSTPPVTTKTYGLPKYPNSEHPQWINSSTLITLNAVDGGEICHVGVNKTYWRNTVLTSNDACENPSVCQQTGGSGLWNEYVAPFTKPEQSCHLIEYYSVDLLGNAETVKKQCVYVENTPPVSQKTVGTPNKSVSCSGLGQGTFTDGCYYVNQSTHITLNCSEVGPHPTGTANIYYKIDWKNQSADTWQLGNWIQDSNFVSFNYAEDSYHRLTWYCVDALGNKEQNHVELDLVDTKPPVSIKNIYNPKHPCNASEQSEFYPNMGNPTDGCYYVNQSTSIGITCSDGQPHPVDNVSIYFRKFLVGTTELPTFQQIPYDNVAIHYGEDSAHVLEWYCVDALGNKETNHVEYDIVDTQPPVTTKNIIGPQFYNATEGKTYLDGVTKVNLTCTDQGPHPSDHVNVYYRYRVNDGNWNSWTQYTTPFGFPEESKHELEYFCNDTLGNTETHQFEIDYVDHTKPITTKTYGTPYVSSNGKEWINYSTPITLTATDGTSIHASGVHATYYRVTLVDSDYCDSQSACEEASGSGEFLTYQSPFTINEQSCHLIEFYSVDNVNKTETVNKQCAFVENTPPVSSKTVGDPKKQVDCSTLEQGTFTDNCYYVNQSTSIALTCSEVGPHPTGTANIYYKIDWKNNSQDAWTQGQWIQDSNYITFNYPEDSYHRLTWYCVDALGNREQSHTELDLVDTKYPNVTKTVGDPKVSCGENCWYITNNTDISLDCVDQGPHPVDNVAIYYRYNVDGGGFTSWTLYDEPFKLPEYSNHTVQYYCKDILGNAGPIFTEMDKVDNKPPIIIPDPCHDVKFGDKIIIYANITDDKVGVDQSTTKAYVKCPNRTAEQLLLVYNSSTGRYEAQWTSPDVEGVCYVDFAASDLLGNSAYLTDGKFIVIDNTPPTISSVFTGRNWIGFGDKFYVDAEINDNSAQFEQVCGPLKCLVRIVDNAGKTGYLQGELEFVQGVSKCVGFVTVNDTFYEAQAKLWVDAIDGSGNNASARKLEPIGIDNARNMSITGVNESQWFKGGQWINGVVATVNPSVFNEVTSCSVSISGVSPENTLQPIGNNCSGNIRIPTDISNGVKDLIIRATNINGNLVVSDTVNVRIDNDAPDKQIISPTNGTYISTQIPIIINATDSLSGIYNVSFRIVKDPLVLLGLITIPGTGYDSGWILTAFNGTTWNYTFNASNLTAGETYYFLSMVCDNAGNCQDPLSYTILIVDRTPPSWPIGSTLTIDASPYDKDGNIILGWDEAYDNRGIDHYEISVNYGGLNRITVGTAYTFTNLADGYYVFSVVPVDKSGNRGTAMTGSTTVDRSCVVDGTCTSSGSGSSSSGGSSVGSSYSGGSSQPAQTNSESAGTDGTITPTDDTTQVCIPYWSCSGWSACKDGKQTRKCIDKNNCIKTMKTETQDCKAGTAAANSISPLTGLFAAVNSPVGYAAVASSLIFLVIIILSKSKLFVAGKRKRR